MGNRYENLCGLGLVGRRMERIMSGKTSNSFRAAGITIAGVSLSLLFGVGLGGLGGCVSYTNVPEPTKGIAMGHTNSGASIKSIVASIERVVLRHPMRDANGNFAVNLPVGSTPETAHEIVSRLPEGAILPYEGMEASVPVYHIGRIWLRAATGKVDVVYPFVDTDGRRVDGGVTVWVHGGDRPWYVKRLQYWAPGTVPTPSIYVPLDGEVEVMEPVDTPDAAAESMSEDSVDEAEGVDGGDADSNELYREVDG